MLRLARYLRYFKREVIIGPFFKFLEAVFELIVPLVMASIIDEGIRADDKLFVIQRGGILLFLGIMGLIFALICQYSAARASQGIGTMLRNDLFAHMNSLSHTEVDQLGTNSLITIITNDVNQIQLAVAMLIRLVVRAPFLVIGATVMAILLDLKLSLIFLMVAPLVSLVLYVVMKKSIPFYRVRQKTLDRVSMITRENLSGTRVIRAFSKQDRELERFGEANDEVARIAIRVGRISAFLNPATFVILNMAIIAIIWFGGRRVENGFLTQGEVIAFVNYMTQISLALVVVANLVVIFTKASASAARINRIFDMESSLEEMDSIGKDRKEFLSREAVSEVDTVNKRSSEGKPKISLRHVSFAYRGAEESALSDVNVDIYEGETVGIIGGTGSGKSTLVNLLPRFYDVTEGEIYLDGVPIRKYPLKELRKRYGVVPQKAVLFSGSILENMRWGREDATKQEIAWAIRIAQAEEFVENMPNGYETMIMQGGKNLSGGQRQRLTIARALVGKPEILILDDSSSALDYATDARLQRALRESCGGMTIFMVSQRASTIKNADKIIVLDDGKVVDIGKHRELLNRCSVYKEICLSQLSEEEVNR